MLPKTSATRRARSPRRCGYGLAIGYSCHLSGRDSILKSQASSVATGYSCNLRGCDSVPPRYRLWVLGWDGEQLVGRHAAYGDEQVCDLALAARGGGVELRYADCETECVGEVRTRPLLL